MNLGHVFRLYSLVLRQHLPSHSFTLEHATAGMVEAVSPNFELVSFPIGPGYRNVTYPLAEVLVVLTTMIAVTQTLWVRIPQKSPAH